MPTALWILSIIAFLAMLACFVMVIIAMFSNEQRVLGIVCLVLAPLFGLGGIIAFILGWVKASEWGIQRIMFAWTGATLIWLICYVASKAVPRQIELVSLGAFNGSACSQEMQPGRQGRFLGRPG